METLPDSCLTLIFGEYCDSPMTSLSFACTSRLSQRSLEGIWDQLYLIWSNKWNEKSTTGNSFISTTINKTRKSKRLQDKDYYSSQKKFIRLLETGAFHAGQVHAEIFNYSIERKFLTSTKLKELLHSWTPIWVNCGGFGRERGGSSSGILAEALCSRAVNSKHALAITKELVQNWKANPDPDFGMRPMCAAAARGFPDVLEFLLHNYGCSLTQKASGSFMVKKKAIKGRYSPHEWANAMLLAEIDAGTKDSELKNLKKCVQLTRLL